MPAADLHRLLEAIRGFVVTGSDGRRRFEMPPGGLDSPSIATLITESFALSEGKWLLRDPTEPEISGDAVVLGGDMDLLLGVSTARVHVGFDLADAGRPSLFVAFFLTDQPSPPVAWNLGTAYPVWAEQRSVLTRLEFDAPAFWFSSIARAAGAGHPAVGAGVTFGADRLPLDGILAPLAAFPSLRLQGLEGQITGPSSAPLMTLEAQPITPISVGGLDLPLTFQAVSAPPADIDKIQVPRPPVQTYLQLISSVRIGGPQAPPIPISLVFNGLGPLIALRADLHDISQYAMRELEAFVRGAPIGSVLDPVFTIGESVALTDLAVFVGADPPSLAAIGLGLGTTRPLTVIEGWVEIPDVHVDFMVDDPAGGASITAVLGGTFRFLDGVDVAVKATFPQMVFTGSVLTDPPLPLARIVERFVPSVTSFPDISLSRLYVAADLEQRRYAFQLAVVSGWRIPIGIARFELEEASLALGYDGKEAGGFSGEIAATAVLFSQTDVEIARFFADWRLPGASFVLQGTFPEISLTDLATALTGGAVPNADGVPRIVLRDSLVQLRMGEAAERRLRLGESTSYRFELATTVDVERIGQASLAFEVRRGTDGATGFAAGMVLVPTWKPDELWPGLRDVMEVVSVRDAGLILSSIADERFALPTFDHLAYVPPKIEPGVTFFSAVELTGDVFSLLTELFDRPVELDLYAHVDPARIVDSEIRATLPGDAGKNAVSFTAIEVDMKPGAGHFSITAGARFAVFGERLDLQGRGTIELGPPPVATFAIRVANWAHPFGIAGLTIQSFGLSVSIDELGLGVGVLGDFLIGDDPATQFEFLVGGDVKDFEAPDAFVCALKSTSGRALRVTDLVRQYTRLDLDDVPLLGGLAFTRLEFYIVADPSGWTAPDGHHYLAGIGIDADLTLYDWELALRLEVGETRGVLAEGSLSRPIELSDVLKISDADGVKGPRLKIDTSALAGIPPSSRLDEIFVRRAWPLGPGVRLAVMPLNPHGVLSPGSEDGAYFSASGAVRVLGLYEAFSGSITNDGFEVNFHAELGNLFRAEFLASFSKSSGFAGAARGSFDFRLEFPDGVVIDGWRLLPPVSITGPHATLDIEVVLKTSEQRVALALDFWWGDVHFAPSFSLDAKDVPALLAELWEHIVSWIREHLSTFFADLLAHVEKWIAALKQGLIWVGQTALEIADVLYHVFGIDSLVRMAGHLVEIGRLGFTDMVDALMSVLGATFDEAVAALRAVGESCAQATNEAVIYGADPRRLEGGEG